MDNKNMDWRKEQIWKLIQSRKKRHTYLSFLRYAAMLAVLIGSVWITMQFIPKKNYDEQEMLSREEKYRKLEKIEQRLSQDKGTSYICYTCFNPYLKTGNKPKENGFCADFFYK